MSTNIVSLCVMFCSGVAVGAIIDCFRHIVRTINWTPLRKVAILLELFIWLLLGCATFYLLLIVKNGDWRVVDSIAQIAGIFAYNFVLYKVIRLMGTIFVNIFIMPFLVIGSFFFRVVRAILRFFIKIVKKILKLFQKIVKNDTKPLS